MTEHNHTETLSETAKATEVAENTAPAEVPLQTASEGGSLNDPVEKESIEASILEKLSRKTDKPGVDPFVPNSQLENEVKEIANKQGFPLSRGTEIGARLMARSKRVK